MIAATPHFVLLSKSSSPNEDRVPLEHHEHQPCETADDHVGHWRFVLKPTAGGRSLIAADEEPGVTGERLALLTVVRGLEALDQPSRVTLITDSPYVRQGLNGGMREWRENGWCWERFGQYVPVKHRDLWQRVDRALRFHEVDCRLWRVDQPHGAPAAGPHRTTSPHRSEEPACESASDTVERSSCNAAPLRRPWMLRGKPASTEALPAKPRRRPWLAGIAERLSAAVGVSSELPEY